MTTETAFAVEPKRSCIPCEGLVGYITLEPTFFLREFEFRVTCAGPARTGS